MLGGGGGVTLLALVSVSLAASTVGSLRDGLLAGASAEGTDRVAGTAAACLAGDLFLLLLTLLTSGDDGCLVLSGVFDLDSRDRLLLLAAGDLGDLAALSPAAAAASAAALILGSRLFDGELDVLELSLLLLLAES